MPRPFTWPLAGRAVLTAWGLGLPRQCVRPVVLAPNSLECRQGLVLVGRWSRSMMPVRVLPHARV